MALTPLKARRVVQEGLTRGLKAGKLIAWLSISR
jgi:hypothetical protein